MKRIIIITIIFFVAAVDAAVQASEIRENGKARTEQEWNLPPLSRDERYSAIKRILTTSELKVNNQLSTGKHLLDDCSRIQNLLRHLNLPQVLQPTIVVQSIGEATNVLGECRDRLFPYRRSYGEVSGAALSYEATANFELYDLSSVVKDGIWAFFAEGGMVNCRGGDCAAITGFELLDGAFDLGDCTQTDTGIAATSPGGVRLRPVVSHTPSGRTVSFVRTSDFFAFVDMGGVIFELLFQERGASNPNCGPACDLVGSLFVRSIGGDDKDNDHLCVFYNEPFDTERNR